jgi:hypothetical protein
MALVHFFVNVTQPQLVRINGAARTGCRQLPNAIAKGRRRSGAAHRLQIGFIDSNVDVSGHMAAAWCEAHTPASNGPQRAANPC